MNKNMKPPTLRSASILSLFAFVTASLLHAADPAPAVKPAAGEPLKVLFIGNSLTKNNDLPGTVAAMAKARGKAFEYGTNLQPTRTLKDQWDDGRKRALTMIQSKKWDYVVLQDLSTQPIFDPDDMITYGTLFANAVTKQGSKPAWFGTWAGKNAPQIQPWYTKMYKDLSDATGGTFVPVGAAWSAFKGKEWEALTTDLKHPTPEGTYLAACVFYGVLFNDSPVGLPNELSFTPTEGIAASPVKLTPEQALAFQRAARDAVQKFATKDAKNAKPALHAKEPAKVAIPSGPHVNAKPRDGQTLKVLFIGNSLTAINDLPGSIVALAKARGKALEFDTSLLPKSAQTLKEHWTDPGQRALKKIQSKKWDYVVLQDGAAQALTDPDDMITYGTLFSQEIARQGAQTAWFMTWSSANFRKGQPVFTKAYRDLSASTGGTLIPVGAAWSGFIEKERGALTSNIEPTPLGTYLSACVFYGVLFHDSPVGLPNELSFAMADGAKGSPAKLTPEQASAFQKTAWDTVQNGGPTPVNEATE